MARAQDRALFDFHSAFWSNLHTYLHALTRANAPLQESLPATATVGERQQWEAALAVYRQDYGKRSQLFDAALVRAAVALAAAGSNPSLGDAKLAVEHRAALESAAPVYRRYFWSAHDNENRRFIAAMAPLLKQHGGAIARRLSASFDATWPARPIPVDVVHDAGPPGNAHTVSDPPRITIGAGDRRHQGLAGLEVMFHEASHVWDVVLMKGVNDAAGRLAVRAPRDLWHALLFFNAGVITADTLTAAGVTDYRLYADVEGMFDRSYKGWRPAIAKHWTEFLAGRLSRDDAITNILREIAPPRGRTAFGRTTGASPGRN
jgi:hypothetical protein